MLSYLIALIIGSVTGVAGVWPISAFGHAVLAAELFNWPQITAQAGADSAPFLTLFGLSQAVTGVAMMVTLRSAWRELFAGIRRSYKARHVQADDHIAQLAIFIIIAVALAVLGIVILEHALRTAFAKPFFGIFFIILQGLSYLRWDRTVRQASLRGAGRRKSARTDESETVRDLREIADRLSPRRAAVIGCLHSLALLPGFSRVGLSLLAGLRYGLDHIRAAYLALLVTGPVLLMDGLLKLPELRSREGGAEVIPEIVAGTFVSALGAAVAIRLFLAFIRNDTLRRVGFYCIAVGVGMLVLAIIRGSVQR